MSRLRILLVLGSLLVLTGCYAASVDTGRPPSNKVIKKSFASSWIYGLVPPKTVDTSATCPDGVAMVETQLSFLNQLVGVLTLGIYTPMQIVVTCAEARSTGSLMPDPDIVIPPDATAEAVQEAFIRAADLAVKTRHPIYVQMAGIPAMPHPQAPVMP